MNVSVSVVIPCFRCAGTIDRAVDSVFAQTLRPVEVILVEDCSGDDTLQKLYQLKGRYPDGWVKVIALNLNGGPGTARNKGWESATQDYIAFLDSDDSWHYRKIEVQYAWMKSANYASITGTGVKEVKCLPVDKDMLSTGFKEITKHALLFSNRFVTSSVMLNKSLIQRFSEGKKYSEDYLLWSEVCYSGFRCFVLPEPLTYQYKAGFGAGGLTGNMWRLEVGELDTYWRLYKEGLISVVELCLVVPFSILKFLRRFMLSRVDLFLK